VNMLTTCGPYAMPAAGGSHGREFKLPTCGRTIPGIICAASSIQFLELFRKLPVDSKLMLRFEETPLSTARALKPARQSDALLRWEKPSDGLNCLNDKTLWVIIMPGDWTTIVTGWGTTKSGLTFPKEVEIIVSAISSEAKIACCPLGTGNALSGIKTTDA
jgi:hypothetical protein